MLRTFLINIFCNIWKYVVTSNIESGIAIINK